MLRLERLGVALALLLALSCGTRSDVPPSEGSRNPALATSLIELGGAALARGDLAAAEQRFERARQADPEALSALVGLARVALARGEPERARPLLEAALTEAPQDVDALLAMANLEARSNSASAEALLRKAVDLGPHRHDAHAALAALTGPGPRPPPSDPDAILAASAAHPYDPQVALAAARVWIERGDNGLAVPLLRRTMLMADLGPGAAAEAHTLMHRIGAPSARRLPVHCYADESLRSDPYWRMRLRLLWAGVSETLRPMLGADFMPISMSSYESAEADARLTSIEAAFLRSATHPPEHGLVAVFTERAVPQQRGNWNLGQAAFLGRRLISRLERNQPERESRTLIHEVMHLYGAVHISPDFDSLMNPSGTSLRLDPANTRIVNQLRARRFGPRDVDTEVFDHANVAALTESYLAALRLNLELRKLGIEKAVDEREHSRFVARERIREAIALDEHLATVMTVVSHLMLRRGRLHEAANLLDLAVELIPKGDARRIHWTTAARIIRARAAPAVP